MAVVKNLPSFIDQRIFGAEVAVAGDVVLQLISESAGFLIMSRVSVLEDRVNAFRDNGESASDLGRGVHMSSSFEVFANWFDFCDALELCKNRRHQ